MNDIIVILAVVVCFVGAAIFVWAACKWGMDD